MSIIHESRIDASIIFHPGKISSIHMETLDIFRPKPHNTCMDIEEMIEAMEAGELKCPCCGETIELDGTCQEGTVSPLVLEGMI